MLVSGRLVDQILLFLHMLFQCIWDHYSNHRIVSFVGKTANGTMNQLCSEDYDLSGSGCFRRISHFIRDPILTGCSYSISLINLLGQQTSPIFFGGGNVTESIKSTSNIQMGKLERTNAALPEKGCAFLSGLGRSRHMEDTLLFHLLLALCDGPIRTCPTGSQKVTSDWLSGECFFLGLFGAVRTFFPMVSNKCCWRKMIEHLTTRNAYQRKWTPSWHRPLQGFATNRNDSQGSYPPFIHAQLLQHVIMHLKLLTIALERSGQPDEAGGIARQGLGNDNECQH